MSSDLFLTQLVPQSFSSESSFDSASSSAAAKHSGGTTGNDIPADSHRTFESTLKRLADTDTTARATTPSKVSTPSDSGQDPAQDNTARSADSAEDVSPKRPESDNLLGVSHDNQDIGDDAALDPNLAAGTDSLLTILQELENAVMLGNQSGQPSGQGVNDTIFSLSDILGTTGDPASMHSGSGEAMLEKLEALLKQLESGSQTKPAAEIRNLIELFNNLPGDDALKLVKTAEVAKIVQNLTALSPNGLGDGDSLNQNAGQAVQSQTGNPILNQKSAAVDLAKVFTTTTASPNGSSDISAQQGTSENSNLENNAAEKQALTRATPSAMPKAVPTGENASLQMPANEQTSSLMPDGNENKDPLAGQKEITGFQLKSPDGGFNPDNPGPVINANSSSQQTDATLQNAKAVNLKADGAATEAVVGKLLNADSGNKEDGFTFGSQQQNEMKASESQYIAEEAEMAQKKFRTQTLDQIVQKAALHFKNGQNEMQIHLKPDFLGQIRMQIITDNQQVTVRILAEFPMVKELIENNAHQLRSELQNFGLDIDELEVSVSQNPDQHVADQNKTGSSKGGKSSDNNASEEDGALANTAASTLSDSLDDGAITRIDFFA